MIAAFHGNKKICIYLVEKKADPTLMNAYKKCARRNKITDSESQILLPGGVESF